MDASRFHRATVHAATVAMLAGCAHVARPVAQTVRVETPGCVAARCELRNDHGAWTVETTPGSARVVTSERPLLLSCSAQGQQASQALAAVDLRPVSNTALAGGAALGGGVAAVSLAPLLALPFFGPLAALGILAAAAGGAGVAGGADAVSRSFAYPDAVVIPFQCSAASALPPASAPLGLTVRGLGAGETAAATPGAVLVTAVASGSRAERAGLRAGDRIVQVDSRALDGAADLEAALRDRSTAADLVVLRDGATVAMTLAGKP